MNTAERIRELSRYFPERVVAAILGVDRSEVNEQQRDPSDVPSLPSGGEVPISVHHEFIEGPTPGLSGLHTIEHNMGANARVLGVTEHYHGGDGTENASQDSFVIVDENTVEVNGSGLAEGDSLDLFIVTYTLPSG